MGVFPAKAKVFMEATRPSSIVDHALKEFIAKVQSERREEWFGLPFSDYVALSEEEREALWRKAYKGELDKSRSPERSAERFSYPFSFMFRTISKDMFESMLSMQPEPCFSTRS